MKYRIDGKEVELEVLSRADLLALAKEKGWNGNATGRALRAQEILWHRAGCPFAHPHFTDTSAIDEEDAKEYPQFYERKRFGNHFRRGKMNLIPEKRNNSAYRRWRDYCEEEEKE